MKKMRKGKKKSFLALLLCMLLTFSSAISAFAAEADGVDPAAETTIGSEEAENFMGGGKNDDKSVDAEVSDSQQSSGETDTSDSSQIKDSEEETADDTPQENNVSNVPRSSEKESTFSAWTSEDFSYVSYEKLLYGCDYTRQITIKGSAISGFSETGEAKLASNTDLVLPSVDDEGYPIVGVAQGAFQKKGLTSVQFPTGMMVDYDDTITHKVTKRGNFIIAENAFSGNNLTSVSLPEGVIAVLSSAFNNNQIETVKLPKTIWWLETMSFAQNRITTVNFPTTCDFQLEMHGMAFAKNFIKSIRLPDYTEVVNKDTFAWNPGKEPIAEDAKDSYKTYQLGGATYDAGVVYMYTDNAELEVKDRIHHTGKATASQKSVVQKLVINDGTEETQNPELPWNVNDFVIEGTTIKGLSESGQAKRANNKDLVLPDFNKDGMYITEIAAASSGGYGLFGAEGEGFDSVYLPSNLKTIGNFAFQNNGISEVTFPYKLESIGISAFQMNNLTSVILPDTVTSLGGGAFGTNPKLERINLSKGLTEIPAGAFGCSDAQNWMENLTSIVIPEGITSIGNNAFAGNNFSEIEMPSTLKKIDRFAFSTKNYLMTPCTVTLNEGLETIGADAFRNKIISEISLPKSVTKIDANTFRKEYSDATQALVTKVYVSLKSQYDDTKNFPSSTYHQVYLLDTSVWTAEDFTYGEEEFKLYPANEYGNDLVVKACVVTGFSENGLKKLEMNKDLVIPAKDSSGKKVQGIGNSAFRKMGITSLSLPENVKADYDDSTWSTTGQGLTERGDFFISASAFLGNALTTLELPDGVIYVGGNAFSQNQLTSVKLPKSLMQAANGSFSRNSISSLEFPAKTDFALQVDAQAFAINTIKSVQIPSNTEKLDKYTFLQNTGMEPVTSGTTAEKKGGIVYMYKTEAGGGMIAHLDGAGTSKSNVQKLIIGSIPSEEAPWGAGDFTYDEAGTTITGLSDVGQKKIKTNPALILPKEGADGKAITGLGDGTNQQGIFVYTEGDKNYTPASVLLPNTLTKIGKWTFALNAAKTYESEMTAIDFPDGLTEIGQTAFQNSKLTAVSIPDSVTTMGSGTFTGSGKLTSIKLSKGVTDIPQSAFNAAAATDMSVKELVIPEGVKTIGASAFTGAHIESLTLPDTLTTIGKAAFQNHQLTEVEIPGSVQEIGNNAFSVTQEAYLTNVLTKVTLHEGLQKIGQGAFVGNKITEIELPSTVTLTAQNKAADTIFGTQNKPADPIVIVKVTDPSKVDAFNTEYANKNSHIVVYDKMVGTGWLAEDFTYDEASGTITGWSTSGHAKRKTLKTLVLPDETPGGKDIVTVGEGAFKIPDDEITITKFGIESPNGMTSVAYPEKLKSIGKEAFAQNALTEVIFSETVSREAGAAGIQSIGERAFYGNKLTKVQIPDTVTELGDGAFATNDITELKLSAGVTKIPSGAFSMNIRLSSITIPETVTEIGDTAFAGARLTTLTIPKSVEKIGRKAFHLHHLTSLVIPGNVKEIGESAFEGTYKATTLKSLVLEEGVESIGKYAFKEGLLESVHLPNSIKSIGENPFLNNSGKDGSHVVELTTTNPAHKDLLDDTYEVVFVEAKKNMEDYRDVTKLSFETAVYTGKPLEPKVTIDGLKEGTDFTAAYNNNVEVGTATVVITGIGSYAGTISKTFTITAPQEKPGDSGDGNKPGNTGNNQSGNQQGNNSGTSAGNGNHTPGQNQGNTAAPTGDNNHVVLWMVLLLASMGVMFYVVEKERRRYR
ncbi:MAG: leucine-rich repeat protein [Coprococcus sp.]|nr:leucine-rich repeat protein [Coprococcus sp.]